ncbi:kielin/chordin-like protein isoform X1 [Littorina saxatilis]|uniref:Uncharacterized protein n=1 Tax=Littorina saxatilis TaxID=31220 RepID=A0AAN9AKV0_9CAEN
MLTVLLLLSGLVALSDAVPVEEVQCPRLPCPLPPCDHPHPTYYKYHDKMCEGCSQCHVLQTRQLIHVLNICPLVLCADPGACSVPLVQSTFQVRGMECPGCLVCPTNDVTGKKRRAVGWSLPFNMCPIPMCAYPGFCSVPLVTSYFTFQGKRCPGCSSCPAGNGEFSLSGPMAVAAD